MMLANGKEILSLVLVAAVSLFWMYMLDKDCEKPKLNYMAAMKECQQSSNPKGCLDYYVTKAEDAGRPVEPMTMKGE